jgi:dihydroflavonol-4-reductase
MRALVTGASGFLGSHLCRALTDQGLAVRGLVRATSPRLGLESVPMTFAVGDLFDPPSLARAMESTDVVFHCAGQVARWRRADQMIASHVEGTRNVLDAARSNGVRKLIYTSSVASMGIPENGMQAGSRPSMIDETHVWNTTPRVWPYGYAKHMAEEEAVRAAKKGLPVVILNPSAVFGSGDVHRYRVGLVGRMLTGRIPPLSPPGGLNAIHIDDVVDGHLAALERGAAGRRYILAGENLTHEDLLHQVADVLGRPGPRWRVPGLPLRLLGRWGEALSRWFPIPHWLGLFAMAGLYFYYDGSRARDELGFTAKHSVYEAVSQAAAWFTSHRQDLT